MDKVVEEVEEENVAQIVTDNETRFKVVGMLFMKNLVSLCNPLY